MSSLSSSSGVALFKMVCSCRNEVNVAVDVDEERDKESRERQ
jgi:formiminotetrahydrofolate cyclodeaminase